MFRQFTFGLAVAACLAFCTADLQAQCVGCGGSTPIYSQPISSAPMYSQPVYNTQMYSQPMQSYAQPMQSYAQPMQYNVPMQSSCGQPVQGCSQGCGMGQTYTSGVNYAAPVNSGCGCYSGCNGCGGNAIAQTSYAQPVMNYAPMNTSVPVMSNGCGCNGGVMMNSNMGGVIMDGGMNMSGVIMDGGVVGGQVMMDTIVEPQATGEVIDQATPPAPVEAQDAPAENKEPAPATETAGEATDASAEK